MMDPEMDMMDPEMDEMDPEMDPEMDDDGSRHDGRWTRWIPMMEDDMMEDDMMEDDMMEDDGAGAQ